MNRQLKLDLHKQLIVDLFAGGGGMSVAFEMAFGRSPDIAVNHDEDALSMHRMNHPETRHFIADVFEVCPHGATQGRQVGWLHLSPDCTHFSQAAAGQPRSKKIRGLAWVGYRWAGQVRPVCVSLENVKQILQWCPLIAKRDPDTGRVLKRVDKKINNKGWVVAKPGERVPVQDQFLIPNPKRLGETWNKFKRMFEGLGYEVQTRLIRAADMDGHTTRERLFMIARCDGQPIEWGEVKRAKSHSESEKRWKPAHECIDFSHPCPSIFHRKKPLAEKTMRRIAKGIVKFVLQSADPFIIPIAHYNGSEPVYGTRESFRTVTAEPKGGSFALVTPSLVAATHHGADRVYDVQDSFVTVTAAQRGELMLSAPVLAKIRGDSHGASVKGPVPTITSGGNMERDAGAAHALGLVSPILVQAAYGEGQPGRAQRWGEGAKPATGSFGTVTASSCQAIAAATLVGVGGPEYSGKPTSIDAPHGAVLTENHKGVAVAYMMQANDGFNTSPGHELKSPVSAITSSGSQQQLVTAHLATLRNNCFGESLNDSVPVVASGGGHHGLVTTFLSRQFGNSIGHAADDSMGAVMAGGGGKSALVECTLSPDEQEGALRVAAFLIEYYSEGGQWADLRDPLNTLTTRERMALVTVTIKGTPYVIVDIGLRMLKPRELYNAQDFPRDYIIDRGHDGRKFNTTKQVRMVGNSVDPLMAVDFLRLNAPNLAVRKVA